MTKLLITYRATIDRYVPISVRSSFLKKTDRAKSKFYVIRERIKLTA